MSRLQSRQHVYYYLEKYFKLVGIAIVTVTQIVTAASAADTTVTTKINNTADSAYEIPGLLPMGHSYSNPIQATLDKPLEDPAGKITGCQGETLPNYEGFVVSLYETSDGLRLGNLVNLTPSELPDIPGNGIPPGIDPNPRNNNPFALNIGNSDGKYNFLLDAAKGQSNPGRQYILVIKPPAGAIYTERQFLLTIVSATGQQITIKASALDGKELDVNALNPSATTEINAPVDDLTTNLSVLGLKVNACNPQSLQIIKSADRAAAEPGDTVIYRLLLKNLSTAPIQQLRVTDTLPVGFRLQPNIVKAKQDTIDIPVSATLNGNVATFKFTQSTRSRQDN